MIIKLIAAHDPNLVIGRKGRLPWHIPEDLKHFRERTMGSTIVMGRGVFEELGEKPLPGRKNIVMTRTRSYPNVQVCRDADEVLSLPGSGDQIYIIGGAEIYRLFYPLSHQLEITLIREKYQGDTFFPEYRHEIGSVWKEVSRTDKDHLSFIDYHKEVS